MIRKLRSIAARLLFRDSILLIPLAAFAASSARITRGISCGHDFEFHLISWFETQRNWSQGVFYPHWAQSPNWGAGEPRFIFYPPLTWIFGALLGYVVPWTWVPGAFTFLCLCAAGLTTRALARKLLSANTATLAGVIATMTPYGLFTAYERTAFSELAATAWIPLLLLFAWNQPDFPVSGSPVSESPISGSRSAAFNGSAAPLAVILAATWLTNAPAGVMASYLLAFSALGTALILRQWWPILRAAVAVPIALGLAAFYLVPAAVEQRWIAIQQAVDVGMRVSDSWLFARHAAPDLELHDQVLRLASAIFVVSTVLALTGLAVAFLRRKLPTDRRYIWLPLALLIPVLFLLQLPISAPIWNLPKLSFLQFPWRWLMVFAVPYAIFLAAATPFGSHRSRLLSPIAWVAILLTFTGLASLICFQYCDDEDDVHSQILTFKAGSGVAGTDEYAAAASDNSLIASGLPDGCLVSDPTQELGESDSGSAPVWYAEQGSCDDTYTAQLWQNEHKRLQIDSDHDGFVVLRLSRYPSWRITVNGTAPAQLPQREDGLTAVPITAGPSTIEVRWTDQPDVLVGRWISAISLLLLAALWLAERRGRALRLS